MRKLKRDSSVKDYLVCKNGHKCKNHDWDDRAPIRKLCTRTEGCFNHDWKFKDRSDSPYRLICSNGSKCTKHDWFSKRSPL
jgi:hypothetical protein